MLGDNRMKIYFRILLYVNFEFWSLKTNNPFIFTKKAHKYLKIISNKKIFMNNLTVQFDVKLF